MPQKLLGLDVGSHSLKAAVVAGGFRGFELLGFVGTGGAVVGGHLEDVRIGDGTVFPHGAVLSAVLQTAAV